jgi:hypothetical protein
MQMNMHVSDIKCEFLTIHLEGEESIVLGPDGGESNTCYSCDQFCTQCTNRVTDCVSP